MDVQCRRHGDGLWPADRQAQRHHHWSDTATILIRCMRASLLLNLFLVFLFFPCSRSIVLASLLLGTNAKFFIPSHCTVQWKQELFFTGVCLARAIGKEKSLTVIIHG
jgi:hypothetical protein